MPMIWNAEADAKLLSAIMKVYDVRASGSKLEEIAAIMGPECTAKALTHRFAKIRNGADLTPKKNATPKGESTAKKRDKSFEADADEDDAEESPTKTKKAKKKQERSKSEEKSAPVKDEEDMQALFG